LAGCAGPRFFGISDVGTAHGRVGDTHLEQNRLEEAGAEFTKAIETFEEAKKSYYGQTRYMDKGDWLESVNVSLATAHLRRGYIHAELNNYRCAHSDFSLAKTQAENIGVPESSLLFDTVVNVFKEAHDGEIDAKALINVFGEGQKDCLSFLAP
jgi:hypothetical protein